MEGLSYFLLSIAKNVIETTLSTFIEEEVRIRTKQEIIEQIKISLGDVQSDVDSLTGLVTRLYEEVTVLAERIPVILVEEGGDFVFIPPKEDEIEDKSRLLLKELALLDQVVEERRKELDIADLPNTPSPSDEDIPLELESEEERSPWLRELDMLEKRVWLRRQKRNER